MCNVYLALFETNLEYNNKLLECLSYIELFFYNNNNNNNNMVISNALSFGAITTIEEHNQSLSNVYNHVRISNPY